MAGSMNAWLGRQKTRKNLPGQDAWRPVGAGVGINAANGQTRVSSLQRSATPGNVPGAYVVRPGRYPCAACAPSPRSLRGEGRGEGQQLAPPDFLGGHCDERPKGDENTVSSFPPARHGHYQRPESPSGTMGLLFHVRSWVQLPIANFE